MPPGHYPQRWRLGLELLELLFQLTVALQEATELVQQILAAAPDQAGRLLQLFSASLR